MGKTEVKNKVTKTILMQILVTQHLTAVTWEFILHNQSEIVTRVLKPANGETLTIALAKN